MKLYSTHTPNSRKVLAVVYALDLDVEVQYLDLMKGEQKSPDYLSINPNGKAPALVDDDFELWESNAIMQYLADTYGNGNDIYPNSQKIRADIARWQHWELAHYNRAAGVLVWEVFIKPTFNMGEPSQELIHIAKEDFHNCAAVLDAQLENRNYILGDSLTLADFSVASFAAMYGPAQISIDKYKNVGSWLHRLDSIPAWAKSAPPMQNEEAGNDSKVA